MILRQFFPARSGEDLVAERVRVVLGGQEYILPVLTIEQNEVWRALATERFAALFADFASLDDPKVILARLQQASGVQVELLVAYDRSGVLPDVDAIRRTTTDPALLKAVLGVTAAAFPLAATVIDLIADQPELLATMVTELLSQPSSSSPAPTAGRRRKSAAA